MYFPSKRDLWLTALLIVVAAILLSSLLIGLRDNQPALVGLATLLPLAFIAWIWFTTGYTITDTSLLVRSGPFRWNIPLREITRVRPTRNPLSSPALSLDRLEIRYGERRVLMISPEDDLVFLQVLRDRCPQAVIELV